MDIKFDDATIQAIFGHEAAEDEDRARLRQYYFKSSVFARMTADLPLRILVGHKGIGKSALVMVAMNEDRDSGILSILIRPDDVHEISTSAGDLLGSIRSWKQGLERIIYQKSLAAVDVSPAPVTTGGIRVIDFIADALRPMIAKVADLNHAKAALVKAFLANRKIRIYVDDLDRGWTASPESILRLSALLNALRDMTHEHSGLQFRVALRSDVYYLVRTADESTDKIEGSVVWHTWTNHEILAMLVKRIEAFQGRRRDEAELVAMRQSTLASFLDTVMEPRFMGRGKWSNIPVHRMLMSVIRRRPRDLVKLCTLAAQKAAEDERKIIASTDFDAVFEQYSQGRLQDTTNEFRSELPDLEVLLLNMKPNKKRRFGPSAFTYTSADLLQKIREIQSSQRPFRFYSGRTASPQDLAAFMYKINFLTAKKDQGDFTLRRYFEEQKYLSASFVDFGFDWEVHPAYRWALQPESIQDVWNMMQPDAEGE
jgi:hypothetical protein